MLRFAGYNYREAAIGTHVTEVLDYTRLSCRGGDRMEVFLVQTQTGYGVAVAYYSASLSLDVDAFNSQAEATHAYDLFLENVQVDIGGKYGCAYEIVPTPNGMDEQATKAIRLLQDPLWGPSWEEQDYQDPAAKEQVEFYSLLQEQLKNWKGMGIHVRVSGHRYFPAFKAMVKEAVASEFGEELMLWRGVYGKLARNVINGGELPLRQFSSWTSDKRYAKEFVLSTPGGADFGRAQDWAVVQAVFTPEDIAFAPVVLPDFDPDPDILVKPFIFEHEFVVVGGEPLSQFRIVEKTQRKRR